MLSYITYNLSVHTYSIGYVYIFMLSKTETVIYEPFLVNISISRCLQPNRKWATIVSPS